MIYELEADEVYEALAAYLASEMVPALPGDRVRVRLRADESGVLLSHTWTVGEQDVDQGDDVGRRGRSDSAPFALRSPRGGSFNP